MTPEERQRQITGLEQKRKNVEQYILSLDNDEARVNALARCMNSFEFWCDHFVYTFDPRKNPTAQRFVLYAYQRDATTRIIEAIDHGHLIHLDKSRDMGASWLMMAVFTWMWLFRDDFHALVGSRVEKLVDNYTVDSLFGKIDYILEKLPRWMAPEFKPRVHRKQLQIMNPRTSNLISGESSNPHFGRGPRKNVVYLDEFSQWENDESVWTAIGDTAPCRIVTSTPLGEHNKFARLRNEPGINRITLHWTLHPEKDEKWYRGEVGKRTAMAVAQDLDIDYTASAGGLALPQLQDPVLRDIILCHPIAPTDPSNEGCKFHMGMDYGSTNPSSIHVYRVRMLDAKRYEVTSVWEYYKPSTLYEIADAINACPWRSLVENIYADPSMWFYNQQDSHGQRGMTSLAFILRDQYNIHTMPGRRGDAYALEQMREMWRYPHDIRFKISQACVNQVREFSGLRYITQSSTMDSRRNQPEKLVDKDNHSYDDFKYFFNSYFEKPDAPENHNTTTPVLGYEALRRDFAEMRDKKLVALNKPRGLKRRVFRYR